MKKNLLLVAVAFLVFSAQAQVGVGTASPDASAALDVKSSNKGFLPPRLTQTEIDDLDALMANGGPANGLVVYNTSEQCLQVNKGVPTNSDWECLKGPSSTTGGGGGTGGISIVNGVCTLPQVAQDNTTTVTELTSPSGQIWMDRNLGATVLGGNGDYYQFGRGKDGHEAVNSTLTYATNIAASVIPGHGDFIASSTTTSGSPHLAASHNSWVDIGHACDAVLYQDGNDPCPDGYRIPTKQQWETEFPTSMTFAAKEARWTALSLPVAGFRRGTNSPGIITTTETHMMASDIDTDASITAGPFYAIDAHFTLARRNSSIAIEGFRPNADGYQIRCIKE